MCGFEALMMIPWGLERFCDACVGKRKEVWRAAREKCWENCDVWFGIGADVQF